MTQKLSSVNPNYKLRALEASRVERALPRGDRRISAVAVLIIIAGVA